VEQIREVFSEEIKAKDKHRKEIRAKRRNQQAEKLKQAIASKYLKTLYLISSKIVTYLL